MLELEAEMRQRGYVMWVSTHISKENPKGLFAAEFFKPENHTNTPKDYSVADTEPLARALAVFTALSGTNWQKTTP